MEAYEQPCLVRAFLRPAVAVLFSLMHTTDLIKFLRRARALYLHVWSARALPVRLVTTVNHDILVALETSIYSI